MNRPIDRLFMQLDRNWKLIVFISVFVSLFLIVFQPFGLSEFHSPHKLWIITGYGGVCFVVLTFHLIVIPFVFKNWNQSGTFLHRIFCYASILFTIGLGNCVYTSILFSSWGIHRLLLFQFFTLAVGIIPIVFFNMMRRNLHLTQNLKLASDFNHQLKNNGPHSSPQQPIRIISGNGKDVVETALSNLVYLESSGNYLEVFLQSGETLKSTLLRCTLKQAQQQLANHPSIVQCHRAFLVNVDKIIHIRGNSQGVKLVLQNTTTEVPVSRSFSKNLKDKMSV